jgi:hypothetical protein
MMMSVERRKKDIQKTTNKHRRKLFHLLQDLERRHSICERIKTLHSQWKTKKNSAKNTHGRTTY